MEIGLCCQDMSVSGASSSLLTGPTTTTLLISDAVGRAAGQSAAAGRGNYSHAAAATATATATAAETEPGPGSITVAGLEGRRYSCPARFVRMGNSCYYLSNLMATWQEAHFNCRNRGAQLAAFEKRWEFRIMRQYLMRDELTPLERWVGGAYQARKRTWVWASSGIQIGYKAFPRRLVTKDWSWHCLSLDPTFKYLWQPRSCLLVKHYICETPLRRLHPRKRNNMRGRGQKKQEHPGQRRKQGSGLGRGPGHGPGKRPTEGGRRPSGEHQLHRPPQPRQRERPHPEPTATPKPLVGTWYPILKIHRNETAISVTSLPYTPTRVVPRPTQAAPYPPPTRSGSQRMHRERHSHHRDLEDDRRRWGEPLHTHEFENHANKNLYHYDTGPPA